MDCPLFRVHATVHVIAWVAGGFECVNDYVNDAAERRQPNTNNRQPKP